MKERIGIFTFLTLALTSLVSAGPVDGFRTLLWGLRDVIGEIIVVFTNILWDIDTFDQFLVAKILLLIIIYLVVYYVLGNSKLLGDARTNKTIYVIVAASIAILSIRFMPDEFMNLILIQYTTFGAALTTFIPLVIFFLFLHKSDMGYFARRAGFVLYLLIFLVMWSYQGDLLGAANWIYFGAMVFIIISLIFDSSIHKWFGLSDYRNAMKELKLKKRVRLAKEIKDLEDARDTLNNDAFVNQRKKELERQLRDTYK